MQITLKPLKGETFTVEMEEEAKVLDLKKKVSELKPEFQVDQQKLIYSGKILNNDSSIKEVDIKPDGFIVVMVTKAAAPASSPAAQPAATPAQGEAAATPAAAAPPAAPAAQPQPAAAPTAAPTAALPEVITSLRSNPRFGELARVVVANPPILARMLPALRANHGPLLMAIQENLQGFMQMLREEVGVAAGAPGGGGGGGGNAAANAAMLAAMMQNAPEGLSNDPQFRQVAQMLAQNPQMLQALAQNDPELQALLNQMGTMGGGIGGGMGGGMGGAGGGAPAPGGRPPAAVQLSEEDNAAIDRLAGFGFDRAMAAQAYIACERNEEQAANFLLDGGGDDDMPPAGGAP